MVNLDQILHDQRASFLRKASGIPREVKLDRFLRNPRIVVISGVRRSGKSTLLRQIAARLPSFHYVNFDDERFLGFRPENFQDLVLAFEKMGTGSAILMDEVQNVEAWERFVRRLHDEDRKVFLTGSNARLLSSELATHLTGRYGKIELYPFSFREFAAFHRAAFPPATTPERAAILKHFDAYLEEGGFPERVKSRDPDTVRQTYEDILHRDILVRRKIRESKAFRQLAHYLFTNFTSRVSYQALRNVLGFKSVMSVRSYIGFLEEGYLAFELFKYDWSMKKQHVNDKKIYVIDNGMRNAIAFKFSEDRGKLLENAVFLELKRRGAEIYFHKGQKECDFIVVEKGRVVEAIQVCLELTQENRAREMAGLAEARALLKPVKATILTYDQEERIRQGRGVVKVRPAWKWMLGDCLPAPSTE